MLAFTKVYHVDTDKKLAKCLVCMNCITRYTYAHHVLPAEHVESSKWRSSKRCRDEAVLVSAYPVHGSARKVNRLGADAQVVSIHNYLVVFHSFGEQLTVLHTSGLVLVSSSILRVLNPILHHDGVMDERHVLKRYVNPVYFPVTDIHIYIHTSTASN